MQRNEGVINVEDARKMLRDCFEGKGWGVVDGETSDFMFECTVSQRNMSLRVWFNADKQQYGFDMKKGGSKSAKTAEALTKVLESYLYLNTYLFPVAKKITATISEQEDISPTYSKVEEEDGIYTAVFKILGTTATMGVRDNGNGDFSVAVSDENDVTISEYFYKATEADGSFSIEDVSDVTEETEFVDTSEDDMGMEDSDDAIMEDSDEDLDSGSDLENDSSDDDLSEDDSSEDDFLEDDSLEDDSEPAEPDDFDDDFEQEVASPDIEPERSIFEKLCDDCSDFARVVDGRIVVEKDDLFLTLDTTEEDRICVIYAVCDETTFKVVNTYALEQGVKLAVIIDNIENSLRKVVALLKELSSIYGVSYDTGELFTKDGKRIGDYSVNAGLLFIDSVIGKVEIKSKDDYYDFASRLIEYFENEEDESMTEEVKDDVVEEEVVDEVVEDSAVDEEAVEDSEADVEVTEDASVDVDGVVARKVLVEDSEYYVTKLMENGELKAIRFVDSSNIWDADVEVAVEAGMLLGRIMRTSQRYIKNGMLISDEEDKMEMFSQVVNDVDEAAKLVKRLFA